MNHALGDDKYCKPPIPINGATEDLYEVFDNGLLLG